MRNMVSRKVSLPGVKAALHAVPMLTLEAKPS
jgi:hypothetical protein